jgi:glutaminase
MVNAGAIACSGLIHQVDGAFAFERIREKLSQFAGRELGVDDAVHASEALTGNRNRAIAWLLRNYLVLQDDVDACWPISGNALSWSPRAICGDGGDARQSRRQSGDGVPVVSPGTTLSVMTSSGMIMPANGSTVSHPRKRRRRRHRGCAPVRWGCVFATSTPWQQRAAKVCEAPSSRFDLHMLNQR